MRQTVITAEEVDFTPAPAPVTSAAGQVSSNVVSRRRVLAASSALAVIIAAGIVRDAFELFKYPFAVGTDGYYYIIQINSLLTRGALYFPTRTPLFLYLLAGLSWLTAEPVATVKIASIIFHALLCGGVFAVVSSATASRWLGVVGAGLAAACGGHFFVVGEFVSNLGALTMMMLGGWFVLRFYQTRRKPYLISGLACLAAAAFSHRSSWAIAALFVVLLALTRLLTGREIYSLKTRAVAALLLLLAWCSPVFIGLQSFVKLPNHVRAEFFIRPWIPLSTAAKEEQILLLVLAPAALLLILFAGRGRPRGNVSSALFGAVALWSLIVTVNPFLNYRMPEGLPWRMSSLAYLQVALLVPGIAGLLATLHRASTALLAALVLPFVLESALYSRPYGMRDDYLATRSGLLSNLPAARNVLGPSPVVISPHGDQFVVTSALGVPSQQSWPDGDSYQSVYWLLYSVNPGGLKDSMTLLAKDKDGTYVVLAKNEVVRRLLQAASDEDRRRLLLRNEHLFERVHAGKL